MMSNYAFWSSAGELMAIHGVGPSDPEAAFEPWAAARRLPPGRLVPLSPSFPLALNVSPGWQTLPSAPSVPRRGKTPRPCDSQAPVATPAPARDLAAARLFPPVTHHELFTLKAWPTWVSTVRLNEGEGPEGWYAALEPDAKTSRFLVRLVPHRGRLPGTGWRNMLIWTLRHQLDLRLVPLNGLPTADALSVAPGWEYRVEAGKAEDAAAWDVQLLPSRAWLRREAPETQTAWEATALLRWVRPPWAPGQPPERVGWNLRWADLFGWLPVADARLLVQNVLTTLPGGAREAAVLFYDAVTLPAGPDGRVLVRYVPQEGLPLALLSTLFGPRVWREIDRAKRFLPTVSEREERRAAALLDLDQRLLEGRLVWSPEALSLWQNWYRDPIDQAQAAELAQCRQGNRWAALLSGDPRVAEALLRDLDVTDVALCLRDAPDGRWRRFVTARRETELREELAFCRVWEERSELTVNRQLEAWRAWDDWMAASGLTTAQPGATLSP